MTTNYDGSTDTMGLVVVHADRHLVFNLSTGTQFLGRVCNSHYHLFVSSESRPFIHRKKLVVPEEC